MGSEKSNERIHVLQGLTLLLIFGFETRPMCVPLYQKRIFDIVKWLKPTALLWSDFLYALDFKNTYRPAVWGRQAKVLHRFKSNSIV